MTFKFNYRNYAKALYNALTEDAFYITMEKSVVNNKISKEALLRYLEFSIMEAKLYGELHIPNEHEYGISVWSKPISDNLKKRKEREKKLFLSEHMSENSLDTYNNIVNFMSEKAEQYIENNFWYLSIVGILPKFQGKGLGPALVNPILRMTDDLGVPTYLETFTSRNMSFYERLGYKVVQSFKEPTTKADYWLMIRMPVGVGISY